MKMKLFIILLIFVMTVTLRILKIEAVDNSKEELIARMTTKEKIAQMLMPSFRTFDGEKVTNLNEKLEGLLANNGFAGIILFDQNNFNTEQTTRLIDEIQKANIKNKERSQLLISIDQEGAGITRLAEGTQGPGNMALGATANSENASEMGKIIGSELNVIGYNIDFAPVVDVNNNPLNPIIGIRSFSDDASTVADFGSSFMNGLKSQNIIASLKHFPGHGDTSTDSHTGLPRIEKTYDELEKTELVPFKKCIDDGAEMIMTAHIQYPKIETNTYTSIKDGEEIELPATLSKIIINDILRNDLGYNGVVITDAMEMQAISDNFSKIDSAKLAINAGVDIILLPIDVINENKINELEQYITDIAKAVDNDEMLMEKVNKAVLRILTLKENHNLLETYSNKDLEAKVANAKSIVGSKENHDKEWEITKKSITLVKNGNNMLPIKNNEKTVILVPYANEVLSGEFAIEKLKNNKLIKEDTDISVFLMKGKDISEIKEKIEDAKNVILVTEQYKNEDLSGTTYSLIDEIIDYVHEKENKIVCISCNLPYDIARIQKADSIILAYSSKGMNVLPNFESGNASTYGVSIPCGIYSTFDSNIEFGNLPVNIPKLDDNYEYTSEYLYTKDFGMQYKKTNIIVICVIVFAILFLIISIIFLKKKRCN